MQFLGGTSSLLVHGADRPEKLVQQIRDAGGEAQLQALESYLPGASEDATAPPAAMPAISGSLARKDRHRSLDRDAGCGSHIKMHNVSKECTPLGLLALWDCFPNANHRSRHLSG